MTFLPIVERELRVSARGRATYRARAWIALAAMVLGTVCFAASVISPTVKFGTVLFRGLSGMAMLYCLLAGRLLTADCLSEEKRDGTFGLLFLTDLKGFDVVLGKLAANSVSGFYGLLAVVPVLAVTLLLGGTTYAEFGRMVLVLVNTFLFSLAVGIFASASAREYREAAGRCLIILLTIVILPPACVAALASAFEPDNDALLYLVVPCPLAPFVVSFESIYHQRGPDLLPLPVLFWSSTACIHALTWILVIAACRIAPRSWQDKPFATRSQASPRHGRWQWWREGTEEKRTAFRKQLLDQNAYEWLAARPYVKPAWVWTFLLLLGLWCLRTALALGWLDETICVVTALLANTTLKFWIALEAGQQLAADRKSGAFELLLCTPLEVRDILRGQFSALRRQFLKPLLAVTAVELILMLCLPPRRHREEIVCLWTAGIIMLWADALALTFVSMSASLTARSQARAMLVVVGKVLIAPWILYGIIFTIASLWMALGSSIPRDWSPSWQFGVGWWFALGILIDAGLGWRAWRRLQKNFRPLALASFSPKPSRADAFWRRRAIPASDLVSTSQDRRPPKKLKPAIIALAAVTIIACALFIRPNTTKIAAPLVVSIGRTNTALRVLPADGGALFLLPDGSLWLWGQIHNWDYPRAAIPQRLGSESDWADVSFSYANFVGIRANGTVWQGWPVLGDGQRLVDSGHDWANVSATARHSVWLKRDGTLWSWGFNTSFRPGNPPVSTNAPSPHTNLVEIGTNSDWKAIQSWGDTTVGLRRDGTLWIWGPIGLSRGTGLYSRTNSAFPVQVCQETNWTGISPIGARTENGELWQVPLLRSFPSETAPISAMCFLVASNLTLGAPAIGPFFKGENSSTALSTALYEIHSDGTLWARPLVWQGMSWSTAGKAQQIGQRTDWTSVWGAYGPLVGQTADGTLWTWGPDFGQEPSMTFQARLQALKGNLADKLGGTFRGAPSPEFPLQKEPRPLMRLAPAKRD